MLYFCVGVGALLAIAIGALNIWHYRHRRRLTPEERAREDEEARIETSVW